MSNGGVLPGPATLARDPLSDMALYRPSSSNYLSRLRTTLLTLRRLRSTYVWPTPQNMMGAPDVYTIDRAAPTCARPEREGFALRLKSASGQSRDLEGL